MKKILFIAFLFSQIYSYSQEKKLIILDENNNQPVEYCSVSVIGKDRGEYSDSKGLVKINSNESDSLLISHILYNEVKIKFKTIKDTIWLSQKNQFLDEVVISSSKDFNEWSKERKEKHQWNIQPKTEFSVFFEKNKDIQTLSKIRFPIENLIELKSENIHRAIFRLILYSNDKGKIGEKINTENIIYSLSDESKSIIFDLGEIYKIPKEGVFLGIEFIGFEDLNKSILENERNNYIKLSFASTKSSKTFYSNKFINNGKWSLLEKNTSVFPFKLKTGLSLIFAYK
ncbi:MAG: hypothetical protein GKR88_10115 [Flavobacteriaceae bacterium]|nr:MAG: hypothetical protein GKR88_10115 [Flavobacteriaceae bacterium]